MSDIDFSKMFNIPVPQQIKYDEPVLVVEDQQDMRLIVVHQLNKLTFSKVLQANNGYEALEQLKENPNISAIICDEEMPVMGGVDFLSELRESTALNRPPFCISLGNVSKEKVMFAVENGVDEILAKPYTLSDIAPKVTSAFKKFHNPRNPERVYELAKQHLRKKNYSEAEKIYRVLANSAATSARPIVGLARIAAEQRKNQDALKLLQDAENRNKFYVHTFAVRAEIYLAEQKFEEAITNYKKAIELSPLNPVRYQVAAEALFGQKRYQEALTLLEGAVAKNLQFAQLYRFLSQGYYALKDYNKAGRYIRTALGYEPENLIFLNQLGICQKEMGQTDEASKTYNQIIKIDPDNVAALYNKAVLLSSKGDDGEAVKNLERALKKDPHFDLAKRKLDEIKSKATPKAS